MQSSLRAIIEEGLAPAEPCERAGKKFKVSARVKRHTQQAKTPRRTPWSMTVLDIRTDDPQKYIEDLTAWAKSILNDLI